MPYIALQRRPLVTASFTKEFPKTAGELNYVLSDIVAFYLSQKEKINYDVLNEVIGVLESAKQELYRRVVAPYEDKKIEENGDVY